MLTLKKNQNTKIKLNNLLYLKYNYKYNKDNKFKNYNKFIFYYKKQNLFFSKFIKFCLYYNLSGIFYYSKTENKIFMEDIIKEIVSNNYSFFFLYYEYFEMDNFNISIFLSILFLFGIIEKKDLFKYSFIIKLIVSNMVFNNIYFLNVLLKNISFFNFNKYIYNKKINKKILINKKIFFYLKKNKNYRFTNIFGNIYKSQTVLYNLKNYNKYTNSLSQFLKYKKIKKEEKKKMDKILRDSNKIFYNLNIYVKFNRKNIFITSFDPKSKKIIYKSNIGETRVNTLVSNKNKVFLLKSELLCKKVLNTSIKKYLDLNKFMDNFNLNLIFLGNNRKIKSCIFVFFYEFQNIINNNSTLFDKNNTKLTMFFINKKYHNGCRPKKRRRIPRKK